MPEAERNRSMAVRMELGRVSRSSHMTGHAIGIFLECQGTKSHIGVILPIVLILMAMIESFAARKYLQGALPFGCWAAASYAIGRDHAYIQQHIRRGSPRFLSEADRNVLVKLYGLDPERLKPPPKSSKTVRTVKTYRARQTRVNSSDPPEQRADDQHRIDAEGGDPIEQVSEAELHAIFSKLTPEKRAFVVQAIRLAQSMEPAAAGSREAA